MTDPNSWLIERKYDSVTHYFSAFTHYGHPNSASCFRTEVETALRFARREDAEQFLKTFLGRNGSVNEHMWVTP